LSCQDRNSRHFSVKVAAPTTVIGKPQAAEVPIALARARIQQRVESGLIEQFTAVINPEKLSKTVSQTPFNVLSL
jgi:hypothetical protein